MRRKKGCSCINLENEVDAWSRKIRAHASLFGCEAGGQPNRRPAPEAHQKRTDAQSVLLIFLISPIYLIYPAFQSIRLAQVSGLPR